MKEENPSPALLILILFCIRILFMRLSPVSLNKLFRSVWPGLMTLLIQIFRREKSGKNMNLLLAALKVIELIHALELEEFHMHKWMFVFDCTLCLPRLWRQDWPCRRGVHQEAAWDFKSFRLQAILDQPAAQSPLYVYLPPITLPYVTVCNCHTPTQDNREGIKGGFGRVAEYNGVQSAAIHHGPEPAARIGVQGRDRESYLRGLHLPGRVHLPDPVIMLCIPSLLSHSLADLCYINCESSHQTMRTGLNMISLISSIFSSRCCTRSLRLCISTESSTIRKFVYTCFFSFSTMLAYLARNDRTSSSAARLIS